MISARNKKILKYVSHRRRLLSPYTRNVLLDLYLGKRVILNSSNPIIFKMQSTLIHLNLVTLSKTNKSNKYSLTLTPLGKKYLYNTVGSINYIKKLKHSYNTMFLLFFISIVLFALFGVGTCALIIQGIVPIILAYMLISILVWIFVFGIAIRKDKENASRADSLYNDFNVHNFLQFIKKHCNQNYIKERNLILRYLSKA